MTLTSAELYDRLQESYKPFQEARSDTDLLSLALIKALCTEHYPTGVRVICDITDQGGDTLVFSWVEDANDEQLDDPENVPGLEDMLSEALQNLEYQDVDNDGTRRMPRPVIRLDGEFPLPQTPFEPLALPERIEAGAFDDLIVNLETACRNRRSQLAEEGKEVPWEDEPTPARYGWTGWEAETDLGNDDDRQDVHYLTITEDGEEFAVIVHRTVGGKYPLDGPEAKAKEARAQSITAALNR